MDNLFLAPSQPQTNCDSRRAPADSDRVLSSFGGVRAVAARCIHWLRNLVGVVLLAAGMLKTHQVLTAAPSEPLWFVLLLIEAEVFCGLGLLSRRFAQFFRGASLLLFTCFLGAALAKALAGARSCGCLGSLPLEPWLAVAFDAFALVVLISWRPVCAACQPGIKALSQIAMLAMLTLSPILVWAVHPVQASDLASPPLTNLGVLRQGQRQLFDLNLRNSSDRTIIVDQLDSSCPCLAPRSLPIAIPPGNELRLALELDLSKEPEFTGRLLIQIEGQDSSRQRVFQSQVMVDVE